MIILRRNNLKIFPLIVIFFLSLNHISWAASDGIDVNLHVGSCNNDGICESGNEDMFTCPADCTPPPPPPPATGGNTSSGSIPYGSYDVFQNLTVEVSYNSATIKWKSPIPTISNIKWGTNPDYKDGVLSNVNFLLNHKVSITDLKDGNLYYFNIESTNLLGTTYTIENQIFRTLSLPDTTPPGNPTNVKAESKPSGVAITWSNPTDLDFDYIRIMKNTDRFYGSPYLGHLVYEGKGNYVIDSNTLKDKEYFYSLFSRDKAGNYSSGSLVSITYNSSGENISEKTNPEIVTQEPLNYSFIVTQRSLTYDFKLGSIFKFSGDDPIGIKTNYKAETKNDDLWVEIRSKSKGIVGQYFFSRVYDSDGFLNVTIPPFDEGGYYTISIHRNSNGISQIINQGAFQISKILTSENNKVYILWYLLLILFIIIIVLFIIYLLKKLKNKTV